MASLEQQTEQQINHLLTELKLDKLQDPEREEVIESLRGRFSEVIFNTTVRLLPEDLKKQYITAAMDPEKNADKIVEITSQVPELAEGIEAALLYEFESLKHSMSQAK